MSPKPPWPPEPPPLPEPSAAGADLGIRTWVETVRKTLASSGEVRASHSGERPSRESAAQSAPFQPQTLFEALLGVKSIEIDHEVVISDFLQDKHFRLNGTAAFIWRMVLRTASFEEIVKEFACTFRLPREKGEEVTAAFLLDMIDKGLVVRTTH